MVSRIRWKIDEDIFQKVIVNVIFATDPSRTGCLCAGANQLRATRSTALKSVLPAGCSGRAISRGAARPLGPVVRQPPPLEDYTDMLADLSAETVSEYVYEKFTPLRGEIAKLREEIAQLRTESEHKTKGGDVRVGWS